MKFALSHPKSLILIIISVLFAIAFIACSPTPASSDKSETELEGDGSAVEINYPTWSIDSDCDSCHFAQTGSVEAISELYTIHADNGVECITCHTNDNNELSASHEDYANKRLPNKLKRTEVPTEVCVSCHSIDEIKDLSASSTVLSDANNTVVNPHDLPASKSHDTVTCSSCHKTHSNEEMDQLAKNSCISCHHMQVFECGTCHE